MNSIKRNMVWLKQLQRFDRKSDSGMIATRDLVHALTKGVKVMDRLLKWGNNDISDLVTSILVPWLRDPLRRRQCIGYWFSQCSYWFAVNGIKLPGSLLYPYVESFNSIYELRDREIIAKSIEKREAASKDRALIQSQVTDTRALLNMASKALREHIAIAGDKRALPVFETSVDNHVYEYDPAMFDDSWNECHP